MDVMTKQAGHKSGRYLTLGLVAILVLAVVARVYGIAVESLWLDEATSLMLARMDVPTLVKWTLLDLHPPLYYLLLHCWVLLGESEAVLRGLSVLASVATVPVTYLLGRELFDVRHGLIAALLLTVAPFHICYAQETRMYAWVTFLISTSVLLALRAWRYRRAGAWAGYVLVTAAALYTHYTAVFVILLENLFFSYLFLRLRGDRRLLRGWVLSQGAVFILFLPWFPTFLKPITIGGGGWLAVGPGKPTLWSLAYTAVLYMLGGSHAQLPGLVRRLGYLLVGCVFLLGLWPGRSDVPVASVPQQHTPKPLYDHREALAFTLVYLVLAPAISWLTSQVFKPMYSPRYMLPYLVPFLLVVARGLLRIPLVVPRMVLTVAIVVLMIAGTVIQVEVREKPDWRGLAADLQVRGQPGDLVLFMPGWHAKPFQYYAGDSLAVYDQVPIPVERYGQESLQAVDQAIEGHDRVWLIWETEHYTDPEGEVYAHLADCLVKVSEQELPLVGRVILFEANVPVRGS